MSKAKNRSRFTLIFILSAIIALLLIATVVGFVFIQNIKAAISPEITIELGSEPPDADSFVTDGRFFGLKYEEDPSNLQKPGTYPVALLYYNFRFHSSIRIVDTTAPTGAAQNLTIYNGTLPRAENFVTDVYDLSSVTVSYLDTPDISTPGEKEITLILSDEYENKTNLHATLSVIIDTQAPVIEGVTDQELYQGKTIAYRAGVTVTDDQDPAPALVIDNKGVDLNTPGVYTVTYIATDHAGNNSTVSATVTVKEMKAEYVPEEVIYAAVDAKLAEIIDEDMSNYEKVKTVFWWIRGYHMYYNVETETDWLQAAYNMLDLGYGDCYRYFALCKLMLTRLGIPNIDVVKIPTHPRDSEHYWSLVSLDGGETYYHLDITPREDPVIIFLETDARLNNYSANHHNSHNRDTSLYPPTPEVPCEKG